MARRGTNTRGWFFGGATDLLKIPTKLARGNVELEHEMLSLSLPLADPFFPQSTKALASFAKMPQTHCNLSFPSPLVLLAKPFGGMFVIFDVGVSQHGIRINSMGWIIAVGTEKSNYITWARAKIAGKKCMGCASMCDDPAPKHDHCTLK